MTRFTWLLPALLMIPLPASAATWVRAESPHFTVYGDDEAADIEAFTRKVERFYALLRLVTGQQAETSPNKLTIFVVRDTMAVNRAMGVSGNNIAGFYSPLLTGSIAVVPQPRQKDSRFDLDSETVLFHEYAHHFMLQYFPAAYPPWYVEGFAEYYGETDFRPDGTVAIGLQAVHRAYDLQSIITYPLAAMFSPEPGAVGRIDQGAFYASAWLLTHYLRFAPDRKGQLAKYLDAYSGGMPNDKAAALAFGPIDQLQRDLTHYRAARKITTSVLSGFAAPVADVTVRALPAAQSAMLPLYLRFALGSRDKADVKRFAADARKVADRYPGEPMALELLAEGELDAGQFDAATKANDALVALRPTDARALLRTARIAAARLGESHDAEGWRKVRQQIVRANHLMPDDAFALYGYYQSFRNARLPPTPSAVAGLSRALQLAPQVAPLRLALGAHLMQAGNRAKAEIVLGPLLSDPHSAAMRLAARAILDGKADDADKAEKPR